MRWDDEFEFFFFFFLFTKKRNIYTIWQIMIQGVWRTTTVAFYFSFFW